MTYEYTTTLINAVFDVYVDEEDPEQYSAPADALQKAIQSYASDGWEFVNISDFRLDIWGSMEDSLEPSSKPFKRDTVKVLVFRRAK